MADRPGRGEESVVAAGVAEGHDGALLLHAHVDVLAEHPHGQRLALDFQRLVRLQRGRIDAQHGVAPAVGHQQPPALGLVDAQRRGEFAAGPVERGFDDRRRGRLRIDEGHGPAPRKGVGHAPGEGIGHGLRAGSGPRRSRLRGAAGAMRILGTPRQQRQRDQARAPAGHARCVGMKAGHPMKSPRDAFVHPPLPRSIRPRCTRVVEADDAPTAAGRAAPRHKRQFIMAPPAVRPP